MPSLGIWSDWDTLGMTITKLDRLQDIELSWPYDLGYHNLSASEKVLGKMLPAQMAIEIHAGNRFKGRNVCRHPTGGMRKVRSNACRHESVFHESSKAPHVSCDQNAPAQKPRLPEATFNLHQRTGGDSKWLDRSQVASQMLNQIMVEPFLSDFEPLASQVDALVGTPAENRLEGHL